MKRINPSHSFCHTKGSHTYLLARRYIGDPDKKKNFYSNSDCRTHRSSFPGPTVEDDDDGDGSRFAGIFFFLVPAAESDDEDSQSHLRGSSAPLLHLSYPPGSRDSTLEL